MNWLKKSQQGEMFPNAFYNLEDLEDTENINEVKKILEALNIDYFQVDFPRANSIIVFDDKVWDGGSVNDRLDWVYDIPDYQLHNYINVPEENFWDRVGEGSFVYHSTSKENAEKIEQSGVLEARCDTRAISNRGMLCAVFANTELEKTDAYGDVTFVIDLNQMKKDGFMPEIGREEPLEESELRNALAHKIGLDDYYFEDEYSFEGLDPDTIAIYSNIPLKYVRKMS